MVQLSLLRQWDRSRDERRRRTVHSQAPTVGGVQSVPDWLSVTVRQRCPACGEGTLFARGLSLREACVDCGLNLIGEDGAHYGGAVIISYGVGGIAALLTLVVWLQFGGLSRGTVWVVLTVAVVSIVASFRYSKAFWTWLLYRSGELSAESTDGSA
ncbi:MAG: DUF983 domain-containing protein [Gemmatimonadales bacterium]|nr:MAG: DUF983 domain-containing protein [Gemmatimonadales bacterium]